MKPDSKRTVEINVLHLQVSDFLHSGSSVVKDHEKGSISQRKCSVPGQYFEELLYFIALQIPG